MKAMLFAAGMGTRLKPLTDTLPKALVPVGGRTLLDRTVERLCRSGVDEVVVNVHHFADQIERYVAGHSFGCRVTLSDERAQLLDTGGGLKHAVPLLGATDGPVLIHNVDILSNADLRAFCERNKGEQAALMVSRRDSPRQLLFNGEGFLVGWTNRLTGEVRTPYGQLDVAACRSYAFSGIHLFSPSLFPLLGDFPERFPIMDFYLTLCDRVKIRADVRDGLRLLDVGKQETLQHAEDFLREIGEEEGR